MATMDIQGRIAHLIPELEGLVAKAERNADDEQRMDSLIAEVSDLEGKLARERHAETLVQRKAEFTAATNRLATVQPAAPQPAEADVPADDRRSIGRRWVTSPQFREMMRTGRGQSEPLKVGSFFPEYHARNAADDAMEQRAFVHSGTLGASYLYPQVLPGIYRPNEAPLIMRDVLLGLRTTSDAITVLQEGTYTNNAAEVAEATSTSTGAKPESAITFTEATFNVRWIAHYLPVTRQLVDDTPALEGYITDRLITGLKRREDNEVLNGDGNAPNLTGLMNTSGIQDLNAAHFAGAPVQNAGTVNENLNRLLRGKMQVMYTGYAAPSFFVVNPTDYEKIATYTDADRGYLITNPTSSGNIPSLWGLPVVLSQNVTAGTALCGDGTMAAVADRMDAQIFMADQHSDFFIRNTLVMLAEERIALPVFRPAAFAKITLA